MDTITYHEGNRSARISRHGRGSFTVELLRAGRKISESKIVLARSEAEARGKAKRFLGGARVK